GALTAISGREFAALRDEPRAAVRLRNTAVTRSVGPRQFFYENSGALVFFLLHRRGERGREDFLRYLSNHYSGRANGPAGIALGFGGDAAMDAAFAEFLRSVR
ncbi:MAG: hypothetical protein HUU06_10300, partial [Planctomycetaceae bacterium]|nr:hypothetical protein [Planctomycetaceae bacterium]